MRINQWGKISRFGVLGTAELIGHGLNYCGRKYLLRQKYLVRRIHDYQMCLDLYDPGLSRDIVIRGTREEQLKYLIEREVHEGDVVLDVGANIGYYTIMLAKLVGSSGRVYALEPEANNFSLLNQNVALNDVVLLPGDVAHMIEFDITVNNEFVFTQRADGMIVATPTGSTAYALSGGGPIMHPSLNAVVLVPMFPHTLSSRPIVIDGDSHIDIWISDSNETSPYVSCDGITRIAVPPGGKIHIRKNPEPLRLIHPIDYNYFTTLREKLGWEKHAVRNEA